MEEAVKDATKAAMLFLGLPDTIHNYHTTLYNTLQIYKNDPHADQTRITAIENEIALQELSCFECNK